MLTLFYARISSVDYGLGTASVVIPDRENQVIRSVPFLASVSDPPNPKDTVAALFEESGGRIDRGVILGKVYGKGNRPSGWGD